MLESETFLGKDSTFSDEKLQRKEEYISQNEIFGINRHVLVLSLCAAFNSVIIGFNLGVFGGVVFVKIDVDEVPEIAQKYQVMAMPTFLFLRKGEIVGRFSGASGDKLREMLASLM